MSATQQEVDRRWREAVEAAKAEILAGLTLAEYIRRTGTEDDLDEWSELLAQFGDDKAWHGVAGRGPAWRG